MAKLQAKFEKWLETMRSKDDKVRPYYITAVRYWSREERNDDALFEYIIIAFNQNKEKAEEIYQMMYGAIVQTEPYGRMNIVDGRKDLFFIDEHPKLTLYDPQNRWHC